jgi:hypothetical protein
MVFIAIGSLTVRDPLHNWVLAAFGIGAFSGGGVVWCFKRVLVYSQRVLFKEAIQRFKQGPWTVRIAPEGVTIDTPTSRSFCTWHNFPEIVQTGNHLFLFTGSYAGYVVPRVCFATDQDFLDFGELCRSYFDDAPAFAPPAPASSTPTTAIRPTTEFTNVPRKH